MNTLMKLYVFALSFCALAVAKENSGIPNHYSEIQFEKSTFKAPEAQKYRHVLSNGIVAYLFPNAELPLVQASLVFKENNLPLQPKEVATVSMLSSMYVKGGSKKYKPAVVEDSLEFIAATIYGGLEDRYSSIHIDAISKDFKNVFILAKDLFLNPGLDKDRFKIIQEKTIHNIRHRYDHPGTILSDLYEYLMYGAHPINWMATENEVKKLALKDLKKLSKQKFGSKGMMIGISGDFDLKNMIAFLEKETKSWNADVISSRAPKLSVNNAPGIYIIDRDITQANIQMGQPFVQRPHPDYYAATVGSYILGSGGFTSRLMSKIRSDEGLVYSVRSFTGSNYDGQSTSGITLKTKVETAAFAIQLVYKEIENFIEKGITDDELERAKEGLTQSIPSLFDTPESTVDFFLNSEMWGRDLDHIQRYPEKIHAISKDDVVRVMKKYFSPENMQVAIVGPWDKLLQKDEKHNVSLEELGKIKRLNLEELSIK